MVERRQPNPLNSEPEIGSALRTYYKLNEDERRVVDLIVERIFQGREEYGAFDLESDGRHFAREELEEIVDATIYKSMRILKEHFLRGEK